MIVVHADDTFLEHETGQGHPEAPERARVIALALQRHSSVARVEKATRDATEKDLARVHDKAYVRALGESVRSGEPLDADTPVSPRSFDVARKAAGTCVRAFEEALS